MAEPLNREFQRTIPFTMHRVTAMLVANANDDFAGYGIKIEGARVLVVTLQNPGIRIGEVAEITRIEPSTLTHLVKRLERDGLIRRRRGAEDSRLVTLELTAKGRRVAADVHAVALLHHRTLTAGISNADLERFRSVLERMQNNVESAGGGLALEA